MLLCGVKLIMRRKLRKCVGAEAEDGELKMVNYFCKKKKKNIYIYIYIYTYIFSESVCLIFKIFKINFCSC